MGSEMCIRDRNNPRKLGKGFAQDLEIVATIGTNFGSFPVVNKEISDFMVPSCGGRLFAAFHADNEATPCRSTLA